MKVEEEPFTPHYEVDVALDTDDQERRSKSYQIRESNIAKGKKRASATNNEYEIRMENIDNLFTLKVAHAKSEDLSFTQKEEFKT